MGRLFLLIKKISRWFLKRPLKIGENIAIDWLQKQNSCLIITSKSPYSKMKATLDKCGKIILDPPVEIDDLTTLISSLSKNQYSWVVGVGGGRIMDISKHVASKLKAKLCLIPTAQIGRASCRERV